MELGRRDWVKRLSRPAKDSHKGQNGRLLVIGGSELFHAASMWALEVASRIVDLVFYASVPVNLEIVKKQKERFRDGIVVPMGEVEQYLVEADCVLIGPGMTRSEETKRLVDRLLSRYQEKRWVIDAGALQMMEPELANKQMILTPHRGEFARLIQSSKLIAIGDRRGLKLRFNPKIQNYNSKFKIKEIVENFSLKHGGVTVLLKGVKDIVCQGEKVIEIEGGNEGMTKGGTGDVLAGLVAGFYCKSEAMAAAVAGSYFNKKAGDRLYERVGPYFNASDLAGEVVKVMAEVMGHTSANALYNF